MTPLAFDLLKNLTTPGAFGVSHVPSDLARNLEGRLGRESAVDAQRKFIWSIVQQAHFFDMTAVSPLIFDLAEKLRTTYDKNDLFKTRLAFLPAQKTWLEFVVGDQRRSCVLMSRDAATSEGEADMIILCRDGHSDWCVHVGGELPLVHSAKRPNRAELQYRVHDRRWWNGEWSDPEYNRTIRLEEERSSWLHFMCYASLALINTPRVIGRRQHMPHEKIEREKLKQLKLVGKFPLRAWTEILLTVALPDDRSGQPSTEAHLTGEKCLHFCRTFLRVRLGQLEYVEAHWRGNPALGMKRSRYRVEPGDDHA